MDALHGIGHIGRHTVYSSYTQNAAYPVEVVCSTVIQDERLDIARTTGHRLTPFSSPSFELNSFSLFLSLSFASYHFARTKFGSILVV